MLYIGDKQLVASKMFYHMAHLKTQVVCLFLCRQFAFRQMQEYICYHSNMRISQLLHATILVSDLARSRQFYEEVLGFSPNTSRPKMSFEGVWYDFPPTQQLHLMQLPNPEAGLQRPLNGGRDRHLAFEVDNLTILVAKLEGSGIRFNLSQTGRRALFCRDPDDNALEFIETN